MARSPLTEILNRVNALAEQIHALPEDERNYLLDLLLPEQEPVKARRKRKTATKKTSTSGNSRRGLPQAEPRCIYVMNDGEPCTDGEHSPIHKETFGDSWHSFQPPASARRSSGRGEVRMSTLPTEGELAATAASGE